MPFSQDFSQGDCLLLCEFLTEFHIPETIEIAEGYDSNESIERSWSQGETVHLHDMTDLPQVYVRDENGNNFNIPLNFPEEIFESIPNRCKDEYETVEDLIVDFPKYVRSLKNIPQSGIKVGDILCLLEVSPNHEGCMELKCEVLGTTQQTKLSCDQIGRFETLEDVTPSSLGEITERHILPTRVRIQSGATQMFNKETYTDKSVILVLEDVVMEKVVLAYTLFGRDLRIMTIPISLEIKVRRKKSNIDSKVLSEIRRLIDSKVNIESAITPRDEDASWSFSIDQIDQSVEEPRDEDTYDEIAPPVPLRSASKINPGQDKTLNKSQDDTRYTQPPRPQGTVKQGPPPVHKKPDKNKPIRGHELQKNDDDDDGSNSHDIPKPPRSPSRSDDQKRGLKSVRPPVAKKPKATQTNKPEMGEQPPRYHHSIQSAVTPPKPESAGNSPANLDKAQLSSTHDSVSPMLVCTVLTDDEEEDDDIYEQISLDNPKAPPSPARSEKRDLKSVRPPVAKKPNATQKNKPEIREQPPRYHHSIQSAVTPPKPESAGNSPANLDKAQLSSIHDSVSPMLVCTGLKDSEEEDDDIYERISLDNPKAPPSPARSGDQKEILKRVLPSVAKTPDVTQKNKPFHEDQRPGPRHVIQSVSPPKPKPAEKPAGKPCSKPGRTQHPGTHDSVSQKLAYSGLMSNQNAATSPTWSTLQNPESPHDSKPSETVSSHSIPKDTKAVRNTLSRERLKDLSVSEVCGWLSTLGLSQYIDTFEEESIDGKLLLDLDTDMMQDLGILKSVHRRKLVKFIEDGWTPKV